jgi:serine/threonine-protein kinase
VSDRFGTWQLDGLIAVGGLGEVWRAQRDEQIAAIKRLHTHLARNPEARAMFVQERRLATTLPHHPHLVHGLEAGEVDGLPYVALELVRGEDLRRIVAPPATREDPSPAPAVIPRSRAVAIVAAACDAASHLHRHGWIHGDINPSNLVIEVRPEADRPVLVDLGVARAIGEAGTVRGTAAYMAPEQIRGEGWSRATDVFALGVVLWELLAGARLFHRGPPWLSQAAVMEAAAPPLGDPGLDAIVQAALNKDVARRMSSPEELAARLRSGSHG